MLTQNLYGDKTIGGFTGRSKNGCLKASFYLFIRLKYNDHGYKGTLTIDESSKWQHCMLRISFTGFDAQHKYSNILNKIFSVFGLKITLNVSVGLINELLVVPRSYNLFLVVTKYKCSLLI